MAPDWSPPPSDFDRRTVLKATAAALSTAAAGALAGCSGQDDTNTGEKPATDTWNVASRLDAVPSGAGAVTYTHVRDVLSDPAVTALLDAYLQRQSRSEYYAGPSSLSEMRTQFDEASPVPLDGLRETVQFNGNWMAGSQRIGFLLWTDWEKETFVDAVEKLHDETTLAEQTYSGKSLYVPESEDEPSFMSYGVGVLGDGQYVMGTKQAVKDAIDVAVGNVDPLGGAVRGAFSASRSGPVQFAIDVPREQFETQAESTDANGFGPALMADVNRVYGSLYVDGETRGLAVTFDATDAEAARAIEGTLTTSLDGARGSMATDDPMKAVLADATVETDGTTTTLRYESSVADIETLADDLGSYQPPTPTPQAGKVENPEVPAVRFAAAVGSDLSDAGVGALELTIEGTSAEGTVDLQAARLLLAPDGVDEQYELVHATRGDDGADGNFTTAGTTTLDEAGATARLRIDLGSETPGYEAGAVGKDLPAGSIVNVIFIPDEGRPTPGTLSVPESLDGETVQLDIAQPETDG